MPRLLTKNLYVPVQKKKKKKKRKKKKKKKEKKGEKEKKKRKAHQILHFIGCFQVTLGQWSG